MVLATRDEVQQQLAVLDQAIASQEALRGVLGDEALEVTLQALRSQKQRLCEQLAPPKPDPAALLAQVQSYIPKHLADKMQAVGRIEGEHRLVTVMFADISGFTSLSERYELETVARLTNDALKAMASAVFAFEGYIDKFIGDAVMAVFGAPVTHENDAERALRAALLLRERIEQLNRTCSEEFETKLSVHIGIHTGSVVADSFGPELHLSYTVMGDTVNTASRLENAANPGQILVGRSTAERVSGLFQFKRLPPLTVRGKALSLEVHELLTTRTLPSRLPTEGTPNRFVGRQHEFSVLAAVEERLRWGVGSVVLVIGEAGIGKSRLLEQWRQTSLRNTLWLEGRCFSHTKSFAYGPFIDLVRRFAGLRDEDSPDRSRERLDAALEQAGVARYAPTFATVLALPLQADEHRASQERSGIDQRSRIMEAFGELVRTLSKSRPCVVVLEDMQWADSASQQLFDALLQNIGDHAYTLVYTARDEPGYSKNPHLSSYIRLSRLPESFVYRLVLTRLTGRMSQSLIRSILQTDTVPDVLRRLVVAKAEGNPFFIKEMLRSLVDVGALVRDSDGRLHAAVDLSKVKLPATLHGLVMSLLDRLPPDTKWLAQQASVIGRVFLRRVLLFIYEDGANIDPSLRELNRAELIREHLGNPEVAYVFRHAVTQEVAYNSLLGARRRQLHQMVGRAFEELFAERLSEFCDVLGEHFFRGGVWATAHRYLLRAGDAAASLGAFVEARSFYRQALSAASNIEHDGERYRLRIDASIKLASQLHTLSPRSSRSALAAAADDARTLVAGGEPIGELRQCHLAFHQGVAAYLDMDSQVALSHLQQVIPRAQNLGNEFLVGQALSTIGHLKFFVGALPDAERFVEEARQLMEGSPSLRMWSRNTGLLACIRGLLGAPDLARNSLQELIDELRRAGLRGALPNCFVMGGTIEFFLGDYERTHAYTRELLRMSHELEPLYSYLSRLLTAWSVIRTDGDPREMLRQCRAGCSEFGRHPIGFDWLLTAEAEYELKTENFAGASEKVSEVHRLSNTTGALLSKGIALRTLALCQIHCGDHESAWDTFAQSARTLRVYGAQIELARTVLSWREYFDNVSDNALLAAADVFAACGLNAEAHRCRGFVRSSGTG